MRCRSRRALAPPFRAALLSALALPALLAGCDLAPAYAPPADILPANWKGGDGWQVAHPADTVPRGAWWTAYGNPTLDALEVRLRDNPDLAAARDRFEEARALAAEAEAGLYPQITGNFDPSDNRQSVQRLFRSPTSTAPLRSGDVRIDAAASWELDIWQRVANATRSRKRLAQASAADLASLELSLRAELANAYLALRGLDQELALYEQTVAFYRTGVEITTLRLQGHIGSLLDVERARSQLDTASALATEATAQRALAEHAIATLVGATASSFSLPSQAATPLTLPEIPTGVPSTLLQRRPDIAAAERRMAAANAEIGVARAAFFPELTIGGDLGREANGFDLFEGPLAMWSIGAQVVAPIFEGGLRRAELRFARSSHDETRALYRSTVLTAIGEVEDQLALTHLLATEAQQSASALSDTGRVQALALELYRQGADNYLSVVVAQIGALQAGVDAVGVTVRAQQASVGLVRALGGGWRRAELPTGSAIEEPSPLLP